LPGKTVIFVGAHREGNGNCPPKIRKFEVDCGSAGKTGERSNAACLAPILLHLSEVKLRFLGRSDELCQFWSFALTPGGSKGGW
jgi:hypothetical protein